MKSGYDDFMRFYRAVFALAALYNIAFGLWAGLFPQQFFEIFGLAPTNYPSLWSCLGMIVGLYGLVYAHVAWKPEKGDFLIAVGLLGKVLGPIGWVMAVGKGELPARTFYLVLCNDLLWWYPFAFYLLRKNKMRATLIAFAALGVHGLACLGLLFVRGGTEFTADINERLQWVKTFPAPWSAVWMLWVLSSTGLLAFLRVWIAPLYRTVRLRPWLVGAFAVALIGVFFDLAGEVVNITWLTRFDGGLDEFLWGTRFYVWASAAVANGLYCVAGLVLSVLSWKTRFLKGWSGGLGFAVWIAGFFLTAFALRNDRMGMVVSATLTMALFVPWVGVVGLKLRK